MSDLVLRPFAWSDVPAITDTYRHYVEHSTATFDTEAPSEAAMAKKLGHIADLGHPVLVAVAGSDLLGYAYASFYGVRPGYRFTCENSIYCAPTAQRRGVGTALMGAIITAAGACGFRQMLAVITSESTASLQLHGKLGFREVGRAEAVGFKFDRWLDVIHMQKGL